MMFTPHLLVYVCAWSITVACRRAGKMRLVGQFNADEGGRRAFAAVLHAFKNSPVSVMVDGVDEDYRLETLPHVLGNARREMLERRLRQISRNALFSAAWPQGRESTERRDDRYLFIILSNHDAVRPWLDLLHQHSVHLAELTVLPAISHVLLQRIRPTEPHVLLVSEHSGGLRLSYFERGNLRFSRLTAPESMAEGNAPDIASEINKTDLYLNSQRLMPRDAQLAVYILDPENIYAGLCREISGENKNLACRAVGSAALAKLVGVDEPLLHRTADVAHLAMLGRSRAAVNLAPAAYTRGYVQLVLRHQLYTGAFAVLVTALIISGYLFSRQHDLEQQRLVTQDRIRQQASLYRAVQQTLPQAPTSPQNLKRVVETARALYAAPQPISDFARVSQALETVPDIAVLRLHWIDRDAADTAAATYSAANKNPGPALRALYFDGEVTPFQGDYKTALASIERFAATLRNDPGVAEVRVLTLPINTDPSATLDEVQRTGNSVPSARFKLKLLMRPAR
ncbi:MAG TPA: hypothetical protein VMV97_05340 [Sulfuriferula sp.]|nr:hypothetical protein [Sulfuriferula sp.]